MKRNVLYRSDEEIAAIGRGLVEHTLPRTAWTHAAHFASALWLLEAQPLDAVRRAMPALIRAYNEAVGKENTDSSGYHETITQASLRAAAAFRERTHTLPLYAACNALLASEFGSSSWLLRYWTRERLFSVEARKEWVAPDVEALPF